MFLQSDDLDFLSRAYSPETPLTDPRADHEPPPQDTHTIPESPSFPEPPEKKPSHPRESPPVRRETIIPHPSRLDEASGAGGDFLTRLRQESAQSDSLYIELLDILEEVYARNTHDRERMIERMVSSTSQLIDFCMNSNVPLRKAVRLKKEACSFAEHSLNVSILATKMGIVREFSRERLFSLTLCAFLGDIGMTMVDPEILSKSGKLSSAEVGEIKLHVQYTQDILSQDFREFPFLVPIVAQIHERENGSGYPQGLKGDNIHEFAKIIGLCDVYIAMTSRKAHREDFSGYNTLQQIISRRGVDFSPHIIKSLIDVISVFPIESLVKLNNGAIGRVIDISSKHPTRPKLSILINSDGERLNSPKYLDLEVEPLLYVETPDIEEGVIL